MCVCKEEFHGNGTDVCIPVGFTTEDNKRGYRWDKRGNRWNKMPRGVTGGTRGVTGGTRWVIGRTRVITDGLFTG